MGLLGDVSAWIDNKKRVIGRNARDPKGLLSSVEDDVREWNKVNKTSLDKQRSVIPEIKQEGWQEGVDNFKGLAGLLGSLASKSGGIIGDWRWRSLDDIKKEVQIETLPDYISNGYGRFMIDQHEKAIKENLGARDLIKAYGITRSSVNRSARNVVDDISRGNIRPEGYFSEWLMSPSGKAYLDGAQSGSVNRASIDDIKARFIPFGMADTLANDLVYAANSLPSINGKINKAIVGSRDEWRDMAQSFRGIGPSKSGFLASLLGRGDMPTLDARQIALHTGKPAHEASKYIRREHGRGGDVAVDRLARRQEGMNVLMDDDLRPFYQHLTHHAVWDKVGGSSTTHDDLVRAMQAAGLGGVGLLGYGTDQYQ